MKEDLKILYAHRHSLSDHEKRLVEYFIEEGGHSITINENCPNCYADAIVQLCIMYEVNIDDKGVTDSGNYIFNGHPCTWSPYGYRIDRSTPDEVIERFIAKPCYAHFFTKVVKEEVSNEN